MAADEEVLYVEHKNLSRENNCEKQIKKLHYNVADDPEFKTKIKPRKSKPEHVIDSQESNPSGCESIPYKYGLWI